jgi:hypothetical protein
MLYISKFFFIQVRRSFNDRPDLVVAEVIEGDATATTRSGRSVETPSYLNEYELGNLQHGMKLTMAEERLSSQMKELGELALCAPNLPCAEEINEEVI